LHEAVLKFCNRCNQIPIDRNRDINGWIGKSDIECPLIYLVDIAGEKPVADPLSPYQRDEVMFLFQHYEDIDIPMLLCSTEGIVHWLNQSMEDLSGLTKENAIGTEIQEIFRVLFGFDENEPARASTALLSKKQKAIYHLMPPQRSQKWMEIVPHAISTGRLAGDRLLIFRDVTAEIRADEEIHHNSELQLLITEISRSFVAGSSGNLDTPIHQVLQKLGEFTGVDRCYLFIIQNDGTGATREYEWSGGEAPPSLMLSGVTVYDFPWSEEQIQPRKTLHTIHLGGRRQTHVIPFRGRSMRGFLGFDSPNREIASLQHNAHLIRVVGETIINALERRQIEETLSRHDTICEAVMVASGSFLRSSDWEEMIRDILKILGEGSGVDRVYIIEHIHEETGIPRYFEWVSGSALQSASTRTEGLLPWYSEGMLQWSAALSLGHVIAGHVKDIPPEIGEMLAMRGVKSFVVVPIFAGKRCWGYMGFDACTEERTWGKAEIDALKTAADSLGTTMYRKERELEIQDHNRQLSMINEMISTAGSAESLDDLLKSTLERTLKLYGIDYGAIYLLTRDRDAAELKCLAGIETKTPVFSSRLIPESPPFHRIFVDGRNVYDEKTSGRASIMWVPLRRGDSVIGAMALEGSKDQFLSPFERRTLEAIGKEIGTAIEKVSLQEELENSYEKTNLYLDIMSHDIKNATTVSIMYSDMLREMLDGEPKEYAVKLMESIRRTIEITDHVSTIRRLHEEKPVLKEMNLDEVIRREIEQYPSTTIHYSPSSFSVLADDLISEIFANLIGNSIKFGGEDVVISIRTASVGDFIEVIIEDTGPGIGDDTKKMIFDRFQRGGTQKSGKGLGLYIVRMLVERYGGIIQVMDRVYAYPHQGAAFRFTLRKAKNNTTS
jgi:signal transduction histidine kinase